MNEQEVIDVVVSNIFAEGSLASDRSHVGFLLSTEWSDLTAVDGFETGDIDLTLCFRGGLATLGRSGQLLQASAEVEVQVCWVDSDGRDIGEWEHLLTKQWVMSSLRNYVERIAINDTGLHRVRARRSPVGGSNVIGDITIQKTRRQQTA